LGDGQVGSTQPNPEQVLHLTLAYDGGGRHVSRSVFVVLVQVSEPPETSARTVPVPRQVPQISRTGRSLTSALGHSGSGGRAGG